MLLHAESAKNLPRSKVLGSAGLVSRRKKNAFAGSHAKRCPACSKVTWPVFALCVRRTDLDTPRGPDHFHLKPFCPKDLAVGDTDNTDVPLDDFKGRGK